MRPVIRTVFFTCVVIFNSIQLSSQSGSPKHSEEIEEDFSNVRRSPTPTSQFFEGSLNINEGYIQRPRSEAFQKRLDAYHRELARGGRAEPPPYFPRNPNSPKRTGEEIYSVPPAADGVFHNVHNRPAEVIDNYLDQRPHGSGSGSRSEHGSGSEPGSGSKSKSKSKFISWLKGSRKY